MDSNPSSADPLRRRLLDMKGQGSNLLVVNDAGAVDAVCHRLGGHADRERRRCYVPITTTLASVLARHAPRPRRSDVLGVIDATTARPVRAMATPLQPGDVDTNAEWYTAFEDLNDLQELVRSIESHFARFADLAESTRLGEIRLCLESLDPILDGNTVTGDDEIGTFLHSVTALVREYHAIGHFHVAAGLADDIRASIEPFFDATVRVRTTDGGTNQHQWTLHDDEIDTGWLPLEPR